VSYLTAQTHLRGRHKKKTALTRPTTTCQKAPKTPFQQQNPVACSTVQQPTASLFDMVWGSTRIRSQGSSSLPSPLGVAGGELSDFLRALLIRSLSPGVSHPGLRE